MFMKTDRTKSQWHAGILLTNNSIILKALYLIALMMMISASIFAQENSHGAIKVTLIDKQTKETIPFANIVAYQNNKQVAVSTTNMDGESILKPLQPGKYDVKGVYVGYQASMIHQVKVDSGKTAYVTISLSNDEGVKLNEVEVVTYQVPLINPDTKSGQTITREEYHNFASKNVNSMSATTGGVFQSNNSSLNVRGARGSNNTSTTYYTSNVPTPKYKISGIENDEVINSKLAGVLTAGEVNDFYKWDMWLDLSKPELENGIHIWEMNPQERYLIQLTNSDKKPVIDALVSLRDENDNSIWESHSDNTGKAELWNNFFIKKKTAHHITINYKGKNYLKDHIKPFKKGVNLVTIPEACDVPNKLDILFMVDATGSMSDEINYLKAELKDIIGKIANKNKSAEIRTGSLFYRCEGNSYVTKPSAFSTNINVTNDFINDQTSGEGGTEAVEIALEEAISNFDWNNSGTRLLFVVLDEPPGNESAKVTKLQKSILKAAHMGIRIIPLVASGGTGSNEEQKSMEYLMRCMALATNGTYAFLTDHSGVGNAHDKPSTNEYSVELLNHLILRVIRQFTPGGNCNEENLPVILVPDTNDVIDHVIINKNKIDKVYENPYYKTQEVFDHTQEIKDTIRKEEEEVLAKNSLKFFPNPCKNELTIETKKLESDIYFCDEQGKILERLVSNDSEKLLLDVSGYPNGSYLIRYMCDKKMESKKLIVQN